MESKMMQKAGFYNTVYLKQDIISIEICAFILMVSLNILAQLFYWISVKQKVIERVCELLHSAGLFLEHGW